MKETKYKFPFIGAGEASYFEWAEVQVIFKKEPDNEQKKKIRKNVPVPVNDIIWEKNTLYALSESEEPVHLDISTTYKAKNGETPDNPELCEDDGCFFVDPFQISEFNKDIERWLNEIHEIVPVLVAFREEDDESGGTEFSDWHKWSIKKIDTLLPSFDDIIEAFDYDSERSCTLRYFLWIKECEENNLDEKYINYLYPGKKEVDAFFDGNPEPIKNIGLNVDIVIKKTFELLIDKLDINNKRDRELLIKNVQTFLSLKKYIPDELYADIWISAYKENNTDIPEKIPKSLTLGNRIAHQAYLLLLSQNFKESISLFETALNIRGDDLSQYCNALYVLQKDNTGLPVNETLNKSFLKRCLHYAPKNPAVFYNACCLYVEMDEYDKAYKMVQKALEYNYYDLMNKEINTGSMFKEFREKTDVLKLLKDFNAEL